MYSDVDAFHPAWRHPQRVYRNSITNTPFAADKEVPMSQNLPPSGLLTSWKEIANFLGKGVRTVQRWEATLGLPVIRPFNGHSGIVMARPSDLEAWVTNGHRGKPRSASTDQCREAEQWHEKDDASRAAFAECVRELQSYQTQVRALCEEMQAGRTKLAEEVRRLESLYQEWQTIRSRVMDATNPWLESREADKTDAADRLLRN